jgi:hypothetical protein
VSYPGGMYGDFLIWFINCHEEFQSVTCDMTEKYGFPSCELISPHFVKIHAVENRDTLLDTLQETCPIKKLSFKLFNGPSGRGHVSPPIKKISRINVTLEEEGIWYKIFKERFHMTRKHRMSGKPLNKRGEPWDVNVEVHEVEKKFPLSELTFRIDKFLNYDETEYDKLLDYIDSPKIPYWDRRITEFRTHLGVTLGET